MSIAPIILKEQQILASAAHIAIIIGVRDAWRRCISLHNKPQEPDFIASLVLESAPILYDAFSNVFANYGVAFSLVSVYCHQTPKVRYSGISKTSCELGDVLFVHVHKERNGQARRNALLYQAKISSKQPHRVPFSEQHQLTLYTDWPTFEYYRSPPLTGQKRDVNPKSPHRGAQYLLIDDRPPEDPDSGMLGFPGTYPIGSCMADQILHDHNHLAAEIIEFLVYRSGRTFGERRTHVANDDWTQTIWDLLKVSMDKVIRRKNSGRRTEPRIAGGPLYLLDGSCYAMRTSARASRTVSELLGIGDSEWLFSREDSPPGKDQFIRDDQQEESGVSIILIETSEAEE